MKSINGNKKKKLPSAPLHRRPAAAWGPPHTAPPTPQPSAGRQAGVPRVGSEGMRAGMWMPWLCWRQRLEEGRSRLAAHTGATLPPARAARPARATQPTHRIVRIIRKKERNQPTESYSGSGTLSRMAPGGERCREASARQRPSAEATCGHTALPICCRQVGERAGGRVGRCESHSYGSSGGGRQRRSCLPRRAPPRRPAAARHTALSFNERTAVQQQQCFQQAITQPPTTSTHLVALREEGGADEALHAGGGGRGRSRQQDVVVGEALRRIGYRE